MRILPFSKKWDKLHLELPVEERPYFTTFRFSRKDKDWQVGELTQPVVQPRSKGGGERLGIAEIIGKDPRYFYNPSEDVPVKQLMRHSEAKKDGFKDYYNMRDWLANIYGARIKNEPMNKLTLRWVDGKATT